MTMIIFKALLASLTATYTAFAMECFLDVADSPHLTEIPHTLSCPCQATTEVFSIRDNIYSGALERELVRNIETVSISDCDTLILDFSDTMENKTIDLAGEKGLLDIKVLNVKNLELTLGGRNDIHILDKIFFTNVSHIETSFTKEYFESGGDKREESSFQSISDDSQSSSYGQNEFSFYLIIGLGAFAILSLITITILAICLCTRSGKRQKGASGCGGMCCVKQGKKVSRAESWRYESNVYVHPNQRQQQAMQQRQMRGDFGVSSSLQQMLPYHLVPQREAAVLQQQSGAEQPFLTKPQQPNQRNSLSNGEYFANGNSKQELVAPFPLTVSGRVSYIDEESDLEGAGDDGEVEMTAISRARDTERKISTPYSTGYEDSNAGSGSYGSRNQTSTLPLNQQHT